MQTIERLMIQNLLTTARAAGFVPRLVDDGGDERQPVKTDAEVQS